MKELIIGGIVIVVCIIFLAAYCLVITAGRADREFEDMEQTKWLEEHSKKQSKTKNN